MARKLDLPSQLLEQLGGSDDRKWRESHNLGGKRKSRKETRKAQRSLKKQKRNNSGLTNKLTEGSTQDYEKNLKAAKTKAEENPKPKPKLKSDTFLRPFASAHEDELRKKDEDDAKYYAKKLGLKSLRLKDEDDGLGDILGDLDYDYFDEHAQAQNSKDPDSLGDIHDNESLGNESSDEILTDSDSNSDGGMSAAETMAKLASLKNKAPDSQLRIVKEDKLEDDDVSDFDDISETENASNDDDDDDGADAFDGFSSDDDDGSGGDRSDLVEDYELSDLSGDERSESEGEEMTPEETMAKLAALKKKKGQQSNMSNAPDSTGRIDDGKEVNSDSDDDDDDDNPYVPPTRRTATAPTNSTQLSESAIKARRKVQSALNKLTESTLPHVVSEVNLEFFQNPRAEVSKTVTDLLIELVGGPQPLQHTMYTTYAGLVASLYQAQGIDFVGVLLQSLVPSILSPLNQSTNHLSFLVEIYALQVVGSRLMYDLTKRWIDLLDTNTEFVVEQLLTIVRDAGSMLRSDDPAALKETILLVQQRMQALSESGKVSARARFMLDSIIALKNNRQKPVSELVVSLRHRLRKSISSNQSLKKEPLQVGLRDILESESRGKWWLVGASWKGHDAAVVSGHENNSNLGVDLDDEFGAATPDWLELARKQRLNTDVRRAVFVALMGAEDYLDACLRIDKLSLKNRQERDIPHVILHCLGQEPAYNPYYALVAGKQCSRHSLMKTFQFCLWDWLNDDSSGSDVKLSMQYARFFASLVFQRKMSLDVLKMANFLGKQHQVFIEVFLVTLYKDVAKEAEVAAKKFAVRGVTMDGGFNRDGKDLAAILTKVKDPKVLRGLQLFHNAVVNSEALRTRKDKARVGWAAEVVAGVIDELVHRQKDK